MLHREREDGTVGDVESQLAYMCVRELRKNAHEKGLGVEYLAFSLSTKQSGSPGN